MTSSAVVRTGRSLKDSRVGDIVAGFGAGDRWALARLLSWIESGDPRADEVRSGLSEGHQARVIGITGPPGAGKSSLVDSILSELRRRSDTVGVIAVDPSSSRHGGALLGDRVRMTQHIFDEGVFIRSMANRGQFGGTAAAVPGAIHAMACFGLDWVLVETVGVGQAEIDIARQTDCAVVLIAPDSGDDVQAIKSGVMEIADVFVVNKSDRPGVDRTVKDVTAALRLRHTDADGWRQPVVATSAATGMGVATLIEQIEAFFDHADRSGNLAERRYRHRLEELRTCLLRQFVILTDEACRDGSIGAAAREAILLGQTTPAAAAVEIVDRLLGNTGHYVGSGQRERDRGVTP